MSSSNPVIEIKGLHKDFSSFFGFGKKTKAVSGVNLVVEEGEIFGFLGPNGAGKTTTIRCMMNFISPSSGKVYIFGRDAQKDSVYLKSKIGYLPGNVKLYDGWTGEEHFRFVQNIRGKSTNLSNLVKKFDFDSNKKFKDLSSGNKQKLGLIIALMNEPEVLIMDEPTVGLDPLFQNKIYEELENLRKKGKTIFISSHNLAEVERLCDRVGIIKNGKMIAVEKVDRLGGKKIHHIEIKTEEKIKKADLLVIGVDEVEIVPGGAIITVGGDVNAVLSKISKIKITDIEINHANLEEIFLRFYK